ncbi:MAG: phage protease [Roseateles sp.]
MLAEDGAPGRVRFLGLQVELAEGATQSWVTVTRTGSFTDPRYGRFEITDAMLRQMVANFEARVFGQDVFIDVNHKPGDGAAGKVVRLAVEGGKLRALVEWTPFGVEAIRTRGFAYLSAEFHEDWHDNQQGDAHGCVLLGAGLTVRPVIKHLDPVQLSAADDDSGHRVAVHPQLIKSLESHTMNYLDKLKAKLLAQGLTLEQIAPLLAQAEKQLSDAGTDDAKCLAVVAVWESAGQTLADQVKKLGGAASGPIQLAVTQGLTAEQVAAEVAKALAARETAETEARSKRAAKVKLLSDTIDADTALSEDSRKKLATEAGAMLTDGMSDEQVKRLAEFMLTQARSASAAVQLATLGFRPASGNVHIEVGQPGEIKALQEQIDRRLGFNRMADADRYQRTGGVLLARNRQFAEEALAAFDAQHGARLLAEHKLLSGGTTQIADAVIPIAYERTVLREMLYQLLGTSFCDVGTYPFASVVNIPYSYRDTTGAGIGDTRAYELQPIKRGSIKQAMDEARPIPQKLAYTISNEIRYLLAAAPMDFDPLAENTRNIIRIVAEDTDRIIHNELLNAADEYLASTFTDTLTAQVNGTNGVFVLTNWPVVRPRRVFNLEGVQQGSTLNPVTVTLGGTQRSEYVAGTALSAGTYYVLDYNLGELRFVNESGAPVIPSNGTALTIQASRATNVAKVDLYPGTASPTLQQTQQVYDAMLLLLGARKVAIENDRFYSANMMLMSGAVDNALSQATTFQANSTRPGTGLNADGSVSTVKGMPNFNTKAPGLNMGDVRVLVGERGNTRFRMLKPFTMQPQMDQRKDSNGFFVGAVENYGDQFIACHTPTMRKGAITSAVLFNSNARVARVS